MSSAPGRTRPSSKRLRGARRFRSSFLPRSSSRGAASLPVFPRGNQRGQSGLSSTAAAAGAGSHELRRRRCRSPTPSAARSPFRRERISSSNSSDGSNSNSNSSRSGVRMNPPASTRAVGVGQNGATKVLKSSKTIDAYRKKRDFDRTPEPPPDTAPARGTRTFVVHRHEARNLHYDLRLEMEGVLKSWAVPRGFSYDPKVKRLAVRTEDHPLMYETFEGVIPKGEYGGGTMTIWDRGRYELSKADDGPQAVSEGKLEIVLRGRKLRGEWHLVKTRSEKDEWILFKARDRYAREESEKAPFFDLSRAIESPLPDRIEPMRAGAERAPFSDPAWVFEAEFDGRRVALRKEGAERSTVDYERRRHFRSRPGNREGRSRASGGERLSRRSPGGGRPLAAAVAGKARGAARGRELGTSRLLRVRPALLRRVGSAASLAPRAKGDPSAGPAEAPAHPLRRSRARPG